jgi:pilus assembly protein CpaB
MTKRFVGVLIFAFVVASGASLLLYRFLSSSRPQSAATAAPPVAHLVVAAKDLEVGRVLKEEDIRLADWPGAIPAGSAVKVQDLVGRGVISPIYDKEPVLDTRLAPKGAGGGLASMIPPGMRAVAIHVNDVAGVAGFVTPGMHVDVLISGSPTNSSMGTMTKTMLQNMEVLSAGQDFKKDAEGKPVVVQVVNLLTTPEQAEMLSLAAAQTTIQLVLRNPLDREVAKTSGTAVGLLFQGGHMPAQNPMPQPAAAPRLRAAVEPVRKVEPPVKRDPPFVMEIINGTKKTDISFPNAGESK